MATFKPAVSSMPTGNVLVAMKASVWASCDPELVERSFALFKRSGNLGRMTIRGLENVTKRYLIHAAAYNLSLVMRAIFGCATPKGLADALGRLFIRFFGLLVAIFTPARPKNRPLMVNLAHLSNSARATGQWMTSPTK